MEAKARAFTFLSNEGSITIPFFQRGYVWKKENWEELIDNLLEGQKAHFLGSIILKPQTSLSGDPKDSLVIDGQQRLTTLSILLKALYDSLPEPIKKNCKIGILNHLFYKKQQSSDEYYIRINHSYIDSSIYENIIRGGIDKEPFIILEKEKDIEKNKLIQCYEYFIERLKACSEKDREDLFNRILNTENKMMVVIDLGESDNEQIIFDTINNAGVRLTAAETIKNTLFQKAIGLMGKKDAIELYNKTWKKTFLDDEDSITYWDKTKKTGRITRSNSEILLHCIAVIMGFYDPSKNALPELKDVYKNKTKDMEKDDFSIFITNICDFANIYREKMTIQTEHLFSYSDNIYRLLHILDVTDVSTFHPFILYLLKNCENNFDFNEILYQLEKLVIRNYIAGGEIKNYNKYCKDFIDDKSKIKDVMAETNEDAFINGLKNITNKAAKLLLFWIELKRRENDKQDMKELKYSFSLEHIMPQKWKEHWKDMPEKYNTDSSKMNNDQAEKDRQEKIYWIGNMTLLKTTLNSTLSNYTFEKKIDGATIKKKHYNGISVYGDLLITKNDIVKPYLDGDKVWNEEKIMERTEKLKKEVVLLWGDAKN